MNSKTYVKIDDVAMGSPLGPILANIIMLELEQNMIPTLSNDMSLWKRLTDDTICCINHVLDSLNNFYSNIKVTIEIEKGNKFSLLDKLLIHNKDLINLTVYRKKTNTG